MLKTLLGFKKKMGAVYIKDKRYPVTWIKIDPCVVTQIKTVGKDGYKAIQLGTGFKKSKNISLPLRGHLKFAYKDKDSSILPRFLKEVKIEEDANLKVGDRVELSDVFKSGDIISVSGISKGKGFAGVVKRYGFAGGPKTHGQSDRERAPGSIGQRTTPGRVYKGKRMAGRMGFSKVTVKNLTIVDVNTEQNLLAVIGSVPGPTDGLLVIKKLGEGKIKVEEEKEELVFSDEKDMDTKKEGSNSENFQTKGDGEAESDRANKKTGEIS